MPRFGPFSSDFITIQRGSGRRKKISNVYRRLRCRLMPPKRAKRGDVQSDATRVALLNDFTWVLRITKSIENDCHQATCRCGAVITARRDKLTDHTKSQRHASWLAATASASSVVKGVEVQAASAFEVKMGITKLVVEKYLAAGVPLGTIERLLDDETMALLRNMPEKLPRCTYLRDARDLLAVDVYAERKTRLSYVNYYSLLLDESPDRKGDPICNVFVRTPSCNFLAFTGEMEGKKAADYDILLKNTVFTLVNPNVGLAITLDNPATMDALGRLQKGMLRVRCLMHELNLSEEHVTEECKRAYEAINLVRAALFGKGDLGPRRGRLEEAGFSSKVINALNVKTGRFHKVVAGAVVIRANYAKLTAFFRDEQRRRPDGVAVLNAQQALEHPLTRLEIVLVVALLEKFEVLIRHAQGDGFNFTTIDRETLREYVRQMIAVAKRSHLLTAADLPQGVRAELLLEADVDRRNALSVDLCNTYRAAANRTLLRDSERLTETIELLEVLVIAYPNMLKHDMPRFVDIDNMAVLDLMTTYYHGDDFMPVLRGRGPADLDELGLAVETKAYVAELRLAGTTHVYTEAPHHFWETRVLQWPTLSRVALRLLTVSISIAPVEASFSHLRRTDTDGRQGLLPANRDLEHFLVVNGTRSHWQLPKAPQAADFILEEEAELL